MTRHIVKIDREKCIGCRLCVNACHQGAIGIVDGKAALLREDYCDGLGRCLPACPVGAIRLEETETHEGHNRSFKIEEKNGQGSAVPAFSSCPGLQVRPLVTPQEQERGEGYSSGSWLRQWPVQIRLVPENASCFEGADLLVAADCAAFACGDFHNRFIRGRVTLIGCPKLDGVDYSDKLTAILMENNIRSVVVARMEVPCCGGIERAVRNAVEQCGKDIPWTVAVLTTDGRVLEAEEVRCAGS